MKIANKDSRQYVRDLKAFTGSNLKGVHTDKFYIVFSYNWWPLFVFEKALGNWYENSECYNVSTSRQKSQCHPLMVGMIPMDKEQIMNFIKAEV